MDPANIPRTKSISSQQSDESHTAAEYVHFQMLSTKKTAKIYERFIDSQLQLEADAREALPYVSSHNQNVKSLPFTDLLNRALRTVRNHLDPYARFYSRA